MPRKPKRIKLDSGTDILALLEDVKSDREPRLLERNGEDIAVVVNAEEYLGMEEPLSKAGKSRLLAMAGVWKDVDADALIESIYKARHESPPSTPVEI